MRKGVFKPVEDVSLDEGQKVTLTVEPLLAMTVAEAEVQLQEWTRVYEGLSEEEIAEVERIALDRSRFFGPRGTAAR